MLFLGVSFVQVEEQRGRLRDLENLIANIGTGDDIITDQAFEDRLKEAEREVMDLLRDAQSIKGSWLSSIN